MSLHLKEKWRILCSRFQTKHAEAEFMNVQFSLGFWVKSGTGTQITRWQESLALHKSFNTLWLDGSFKKPVFF